MKALQEENEQIQRALSEDLCNQVSRIQCSHNHSPFSVRVILFAALPSQSALAHNFYSSARDLSTFPFPRKRVTPKLDDTWRTYCPIYAKFTLVQSASGLFGKNFPLFRLKRVTTQFSSSCFLRSHHMQKASNKWLFQWQSWTWHHRLLFSHYKEDMLSLLQGTKRSFT